MAMLGCSEHRLLRDGGPPSPLAATELKPIELSPFRDARLLYASVSLTATSPMHKLPSKHSDL